jgi:hypothetical protein
LFKVEKATLVELLDYASDARYDVSACPRTY